MPSPLTSQQTTADYATDPTIGITKFPTATVASPKASSVSDATGTSAGDIFGDIGSGLTSLLPGGSNAPTGMALAGTGLGLAAASQAQKDLAALSAKEQALGQPYVDAGKADLAKYQSGTISPAEQAAADYMKSAGATNISEAAPLLQLGNTYLGYAATNTLPPNVEAKLAQDVAAQKAAATQQYGADSSALTAVLAQIDGQAAQTRQNLINTYGTQGQSYYASGTALQQTGQKDTAAGYQSIVNDIQQNLTNAMAEAALGFGPIEKGIQAEIQGDAAIADALMGMFGELYKNVAAATAPSSGGGGAKVPSSITGNAPAGSTASQIRGADTGTNPLRSPGQLGPSTGGVPSTIQNYNPVDTNVLDQFFNQKIDLSNSESYKYPFDKYDDQGNILPGFENDFLDPAGQGGDIITPWNSGGTASVEIADPTGAYNAAVDGASGGGGDPLEGIAPDFSTADTYTPPEYVSYVSYDGSF